MKLSYRERLLGLYIGVDATIVDQYAAPMEKFRRLVYGVMIVAAGDGNAAAVAATVATAGGVRGVGTAGAAPSPRAGDAVAATDTDTDSGDPEPGLAIPSLAFSAALAVALSFRTGALCDGRKRRTVMRLSKAPAQLR